ncbi:heme biosynthesis HemY N-terminal domain-containing protein [Pigmentiphaga litoralis]|uniref:HemY protein n=1 Tax=Pigmentiphaga litoralis TaxID=516702 RepID=A0A7Y9ITD2_9BURK|nr:heme biosynthesis HemY N-terminal domain-containing protein [Pigmentiphaga litoralis]NYE23664.1 HemY protein [Pigmentiphaga litoralis]NYE82722.1 HemY protein [Pigmentiphaga litoralis]
MRSWIWTLLLLVAAVGLAVGVRYHSGNVALLLPPYRVELSASLAALLLLITFIALHVALRTVAWTLGLPTRVREWRERRALAQQQQLLERGWIGLLEGRYARAEADMGNVADQTDVASRKVLALLSAARAAHAMQEYVRRDALLVRARDAAAADPALKPATMIVEADMLLDQHRPADALALLSQLHENGPRHMHSLRLELRAHRDLGHWADVLKLARTLSKRNALHPAASARMIATAAAGLLTSSDIVTRRAIWKDLKADERTLPEVALAAAAVFDADGEEARTRKVLEDAIETDFAPALLQAYARCGGDEIRPRLETAERWLQSRPNDPDLLQALGSLCLCGRLWGPAQRYLERSLAARSDPRTHALLASLFDRTNRGSDAVRHWRLATEAVVGLPVLKAAADTMLFDPVAAPQFESEEPVAPDRAAGL